MELSRRTFLSLPLLLAVRTGLAQQSPQNNELWMIQPQLPTPPLRYRYAYPGIEYAVPLAARVVLPVTYTIRSPSNATVDAKGMLRFVAPSSGTVTVDLTMTDARGYTKDLSWTVTVDPNQFIFVDGNASAGGDGSFSSPFQSFTDFWVDNPGSSYPYKDKFVYVRAGTYRMPGPSNARMTINQVSGVMGYPGETVVFNCNLPTAGAHWSINKNDCFFHNIAHINAFKRVYWYENFDNLIIAEDTVSSMTADGSDNIAYLQIMNDALWNGVQGTEPPPLGAAGVTYRKHNALLQGCDLTIPKLGVGMYGTYNLGIMYNKFTLTDNPNMYACVNGKSTNWMTTMVGNELYAPPNSSVEANRPYTLNIPGQYYGVDWFVANNLFVDAPTMVGAYTAIDPVDFLYNTFACNIVIRRTKAGDGPIVFDKNVIVNDGTEDHIIDSPSEHWSPETQVTVIKDNLMGSHADQIIDATYRLTNPNLLGKYGHIRGPLPSSPRDINIS